jgi:hypothetical protein
MVQLDNERIETDRIDVQIKRAHYSYNKAHQDIH